jgi:macrocin-O-methyltransferase TylF-like protien
MTIPVPTHEIRAAGPGPDRERLRAAYLDLITLALCDLVGNRTTGVGRMEDDRVFSRELDGEQLQLRTNGMDWPLNGLTMIGLARLRDLRRCVESIVERSIEGDLIEAGSWRGGASILIRATLDSLGADERIVWVADSFQGFPRADASRYPRDSANDLDMFDFLAVPLDEVKASFSRLGLEAGVEFVPGLFQATMPTLRGRRWSLIRLDGDTYESTWLALEALYPGLSLGGELIVDDYGAFDECRAAVDDFRRRHRIAEPLEEIDWAGVRWRRDSDAGPAATAPEPTRSGDSARVPASRRTGPVPTLRELQLEEELAAIRAERRGDGGKRRDGSAARRVLAGALRRLRGGGR